jgi:hypothetical protein
VAVVDPRTRENLHGHVEQLGQAVSGAVSP